MSGKVIFTKDLNYEVERARALSIGFLRKFYVYSDYFTEVDKVRSLLPDFLYIPLSETFSPKYSFLLRDNTEKDFIVIKYPRFSDIMNKNIGAYQDTVKGYKLVIDRHPFLEKKDVYWCYFLWSFFDRSLLGYPHCYAFSRAKCHDGIDPLDPKEIASRVYRHTETTINNIYTDDFIINRVILDDVSKGMYQELKAKLFDTETKPSLIVSKLSNFVKSRDSNLRKGLNLVNLGGIYSAYEKGERRIYLSDAKVDEYLEGEFNKHVYSVNVFMSSLWRLCNG